MGLNPWEQKTYMYHRADLHSEFKRLALQIEGVGQPCTLRLSSGIVHCDPQNGIVTLENGETASADLIIAADGVNVSFHSRPALLLLLMMVMIRN